MDEKTTPTLEQRTETESGAFGFGPGDLDGWTPVGGDGLALGEMLRYPVAEEAEEHAAAAAAAEVVAVTGLVDRGWARVDDESLDLSAVLESLDEAAQASEASESLAIVGSEAPSGAGQSEQAGGYTVVADADSNHGADFDPSLS